MTDYKRFALFVAFSVVASSAGAGLQEAKEALERQDYTRAVIELRPLADAGNAAAQETLGALYATGSGVTKDVGMAIKYLRLAAEAGRSESQYLLGAFYLQGDGVPKNLSLAKSWLEKAAAQGNPKAIRALAVAEKELQARPTEQQQLSKPAAELPNQRTSPLDELLRDPPKPKTNSPPISSFFDGLRSAILAGQPDKTDSTAAWSGIRFVNNIRGFPGNSSSVNLSYIEEAYKCWRAESMLITAITLIQIELGGEDLQYELRRRMVSLVSEKYCPEANAKRFLEDVLTVVRETKGTLGERRTAYASAQQNARKQAHEAQTKHDAQVREGKAQVVSIRDAATKHSAQSGNSVILYPTFQPDRRFYVAFGTLQEWDGNVMVATLGKKSFGIVINRNTIFIGNSRNELRSGLPVFVVGTYDDVLRGPDGAIAAAFTARYISNR